MDILTNFERWLKQYPWGYRGKFDKSLVLLSKEYQKSHPQTYELIIGLLALAFKAGQSQYWREQRRLDDEGLVEKPSRMFDDESKPE